MKHAFVLSTASSSWLVPLDKLVSKLSFEKPKESDRYPRKKSSWSQERVCTHMVT